MAKSKTPMTKAAAARIEAANAKFCGGKTPKASFVSRAKAAAAKNAAASRPAPNNGPSKTGNKSGKGRGNNPPNP